MRKRYVYAVVIAGLIGVCAQFAFDFVRHELPTLGHRIGVQDRVGVKLLIPAEDPGIADRISAELWFL
ncbi:MAG: hypothetical protein ACRD3W_21270, partial [Terriglobales bacterium]